MFILEEQRHIHEDLERLEQGVADRVREEPKHVSIAMINAFACADRFGANIFVTRSVTASTGTMKFHSYWIRSRRNRAIC